MIFNYTKTEKALVNKLIKDVCNKKKNLLYRLFRYLYFKDIGDEKKKDYLILNDINSLL